VIAEYAKREKLARDDAARRFWQNVIRRTHAEVFDPALQLPDMETLIP